MSDIDLDSKIESIFDRADDLMINKHQYADAVNFNSFRHILGKTLWRNLEARPWKYWWIEFTC